MSETDHKALRVLHASNQRRDSRSWSIEEDILLITRKRERVPMSAISKEFPNRSFPAVMGRVRELHEAGIPGLMQERKKQPSSDAGWRNVPAAW